MQISKSEAARRRGVSRTAVHTAIRKGDLVEDESGKLDDGEPTNALWLNRHPGGGSGRQRRKAGMKADDVERRASELSASGESIQELERRKLAGDAAWSETRARIAERKEAEAKNELIPTEVALHWKETFAAGIRTNILPIGERVARGDKKLRQRIERELQRALERTVATVDKETRRYVQQRTKEQDRDETKGRKA